MVSNFDLNRTALNNQMMGLSTDTKPTTGILPNSLFWELDTNGMYYFDGTQWQSIGGSGGGGGGGSSDFSTAQVTFLNSLGDGNRAAYAVAVISVLSDGVGYYTGSVDRNEEKVVTVPLYKGKLSFPLISVFVEGVDMEVFPQFTGNAELSGTTIIITGDCTINAAGRPVA